MFHFSETSVYFVTKIGSAHNDKYSFWQIYIVLKYESRGTEYLRECDELLAQK